MRENLRYFARVLGVPHTHVDRSIATVAVGEIAGRLAGRLSGGQRARVSLGVALLGEPELLVLDEPTVGLDPVLRRDLWELFHELAGAGVTVLVSSHVMDEARHCDELVLLRDGRLLATGTPDGIQARVGAQHLEDAFLRLIEQEQAVGGGVP